MTNIPADVQFGLLPRDKSVESARTLKAAPFEALPRRDWQPVCWDAKLPIYSQLDGMCAANAACKELMRLRHGQGLKTVVLSPEILYATHSRWGTGSTLAQNLDALVEIGVPSRTSAPQKNYGRIRDYGDLAEEAKVYRVLEWLDCDGDFDLLATALQKGFTGVIGVNWPGGGGHSVHVDELWIEGKTIGMAGSNSWGVSSQNPTGRWRLTERQLGSMEGFGCWVGHSCRHAEWGAT